MIFYFNKNSVNGYYAISNIDATGDLNYLFATNDELCGIDKLVSYLKEVFPEDKVEIHKENMQVKVRFPYAEEEAQFILMTSDGIEI